MIAVTGSTGKLGHLVIQELAKVVPKNQIVALARNPTKAKEFSAQGIQVRQADYNDPSSLNEALKGINQLLIISSSEVGQREPQHKNIISAAKVNKVNSVVYTSLLGLDSTKMALATEHRATEQAIKQSGIPFTILRNGWYTENYTENMAPVLESGAAIGAAGTGRFSSATRLDYALAAVKVLTQKGHENKVYELGGSESFTLSDYAKELSAQTNKNIVYKDMPQTEYANLLTSFGIPEGFAQVLADCDRGAKEGELYTDSKDLENLIGRKTTSLKDAIKLALSK